MAGMADACIDLTVTSPPYDNLRTYNGSLDDWTPAKWQAVIAELYRVTKPGGVVVWVVGDATVNGSETGASFRQALYAMDCGFRLHDTMIWRKTNPPPQTKEGRRYTSAYEFMFVWVKGPLGTFNPIHVPTKTAGAVSGGGTQRTPDGGARADRLAARQGRVVNATKPLQNVWDLAKQGQGALHPAQFPEAIAHDHIISWSNAGDTVFDPFTGSGTTGKMAVQLGRRFIGVERDPQYFAIAERRIADAANAAPLFDAAE
jgi:DNA modification methylase